MLALGETLAINIVHDFMVKKRKKRRQSQFWIKVNGIYQGLKMCT